jgi:hypothetical protein
MASAYDPQAWSADKLPPEGFIMTISRQGTTSEQVKGCGYSTLVVNERVLGPRGGITFPLSPERFATLYAALRFAQLIRIDVCDDRPGLSTDTKDLGSAQKEAIPEANRIVRIECIARRLRHWISEANRHRAPDCTLIVIDGVVSYEGKPLREVAA